MSIAVTAGVATVAAAGYGMYSSSKAAGDAKDAASQAAKPVDFKRDIGGYVKGMNQNLPSILKGEQKYRSQFQGLNLRDMNSFMGGVNGQQGLIGAGGAAQQASQQQLNAARSSEFANMAGNTGTMRGILDRMSPEAAAAVARAQQTAQNAQGLEAGFAGRADGMMSQYGAQVGNYAPTISGANADPRMAQVMAQEAFARRGTLSQEEQRAAQQSAREAAAASGRIGGNSGIAAEVLNRESAMAGRRAEASGMGQQAFGQTMNAAQQQFANEQAYFGQRMAGGQQNMAERSLGFSQLMGIEQQRAMMREEAAQANTRSYELGAGFYSQPGLQLLGGTPASMGLGQNYLTQGIGAIGAGTPQMYDIGSALNMGAAQRQNATGAAGAAAQAGAAQSAGLYNMAGGIAQGLGSYYGSRPAPIS